VTGDSVLPILWRRRWIILACVLVFVAAAVVISKTVAKEYVTSADLLIVQKAPSQSFDAVQAAQVSARTYGAIVTSSTVAQLVADDLESRYTREQLSAKVTADPVPETQLLRITVSDESPDEAKHLTDVYTRIFVNYAQTRLFRSTNVSVSVAAVASLPDSPTKPKPKLYVLVAVLLGLGFGIAVAMLRERLDTRVRSPERIESDAGLPILARLPSPSGARGDLHRQVLTESLRLTRATLKTMTHGRALRSIAVTSYGQGEGKSTTVIHLALAVASSGGEVVAVEADFRRPALQRFFLSSTKEPLLPGLTSFVMDAAERGAVTYPTPYPSVSIIPAGPPVPSLSGLLQSDRCQGLIEDLSSPHDLILFDLPPLTAGADAATVAAATDGVILVVDMEQATKATIQESVRQLNAVGANVLGLIINRDPTVHDPSYGLRMSPAHAAT